MKALRMLIWLSLLTGVVYPLAMTGIAQVAFRHKANGSLEELEGKIVGSAFIGQKFESQKYFWSRPSAVGYQTLPSGASNLGPTSAQLKKLVEGRKNELQRVYHTEQIPSELLYASGSGLDPHITLEGAYLQIDRVSRARQMDRERVKSLVDQLTQKHPFAFAGIKKVNVFMLNLALEELDGRKA